jgi:RNA-binding protein 5/10
MDFKQQKNLLDSAACQAGQARKEAAADTLSEGSAPAYRDRAAERRSVFNQPAIPLPEAARASTSSKRKFEAPVAPPKPEPALEPAKDESNKGNQLLKKMGWAAGSGLGLEGEGRVAPVEALLYGERVGLGATKGRDPTKYQGPEGYASMVKDGVSPVLSFCGPRLTRSL